MFSVNPSTVIALCLAGAVFGVCMVAATCFCYRRRRAANGKRHGPEQPLAFHSHRRPTAVKSPAGASSHYLKKSPSPTGPGRSPPGVSNFRLNFIVYSTQCCKYSKSCILI